MRLGVYKASGYHTAWHMKFRILDNTSAHLYMKFTGSTSTHESPTRPFLRICLQVVVLDTLQIFLEPFMIH